MVKSPGGSLVDGAAGTGINTTNGGSSGDANAAQLRSRQLSSLPTGKRSSQNASNPYKAHPPTTTTTRLGTEALETYERKRKLQLEEASHGISEAVKAGDSAPLMPRDPNRTYGSKDCAQSKKRKCMSTSDYLSVFKSSSKGQATAVIVRPGQPSIPKKTKKVKQSPFQKLQKLPDGCHPDFDNHHVCSVNNPREFWHKSQGAVFVDVAVAADPDHVEAPILASPQNHMTVEYPPAEAEPTDTLLVMATQDLRTGTQTSCLTLDAQHQRMCSDDSSKMNVELDTAAQVFLKGITSNHFGDSSAVIEDKNSDTVADPLNSENHSYIAPHVPAVLPDASEVDTQIDQSNMPAQHSTGLPAQQNTAITGHPQAEAEPSSNLDNESAQSLQPDIQPSSSILDADSSQTWLQPETAPVLSQGGSTYHHLVDGRMGFDVDNNAMVYTHQAHSEPPTFAAPQSPEMLPFYLDVGTRANLSSTSPLQSSDVPSSPPPAVAVSPGMLGTQLEQDLLPDMAPSTSLSGVPLQRIQTGCRPDRATDFSEAGETEYLTCATCNLTTLPASREAETENGQASVPAQEIRSPHARHNLATSQPLVDDLQPPTSILSEEAEMSSMLCATAAQDLQHGMQPSIPTHDVRLERTDLSGVPVTLSTTVLQRVEPSRDPHAEQAQTLGILSARDLRPEVQPSSPMQDQPAEVEGAGTSGTIAAQTLQSETQSSTSVQYNPPEITHPDELELWKTGLSKNLEQKKSKVGAECNQENEKIKKKFELILQKEDQAYHQSKKYIDDAYMKVFFAAING